MTETSFIKADIKMTNRMRFSISHDLYMHKGMLYSVWCSPNSCFFKVKKKDICNGWHLRWSCGH